MNPRHRGLMVNSKPEWETILERNERERKEGKGEGGTERERDGGGDKSTSTAH